MLFIVVVEKVAEPVLNHLFFQTNYWLWAYRKQQPSFEYPMSTGVQIKATLSPDKAQYIYVAEQDAQHRQLSVINRFVGGSNSQLHTLLSFLVMHAVTSRNTSQTAGEAYFIKRSTLSAQHFNTLSQSHSYTHTQIITHAGDAVQDHCQRGVYFYTCPALTELQKLRRILVMSTRQIRNTL